MIFYPSYANNEDKDSIYKKHHFFMEIICNFLSFFLHCKLLGLLRIEHFLALLFETYLAHFSCVSRLLFYVKLPY